MCWPLSGLEALEQESLTRAFALRLPQTFRHRLDNSLETGLPRPSVIGCTVGLGALAAPKFAPSTSVLSLPEISATGWAYSLGSLAVVALALWRPQNCFKN